MKIFVNLKRFDIPPALGGVNRIADAKDWGGYIVAELGKLLPKDTDITVYLPEAHLLSAIAAQTPGNPVKVGCQSVFRDDTAVGGNFGAFTTQRTANAMKNLGCAAAIIGHCEERRDKAGILAEAGVTDTAAVNRLLNKEIKCAIAAGLDVLYCIGETSEEQPAWQEVLKAQLDIGLEGVDKSKVSIAYEPVWAIGPGKTPPNADYIRMIAQFIQAQTGGLDVAYGGGLKVENAAEVASVKEVEGGLIALTRFAGEIGFYPAECAEIIKTYRAAKGE